MQVLDRTIGEFIRMICQEEENKVGLPTGLHLVKEKVYVSDFTDDHIVICI